MLYHRENPGALLHKLGVGGVVLSGATSYDCYPQGAAPATVTGAAQANTDGAATTLIAAAAIAADYIATHLATVMNSATLTGTAFVSLRQVAAGTVRRFIADRSRYSTSSYMECWPLVPSLFAGGLGAEAVLRCEQPSFVKLVYLEICKAQPHLIPDLLRIDPRSASDLLPTTPAGTAVVAAAGAWNYTAAPTQIAASVGTSPILVTAVHITSAAAVHAQVSLMTGAGAAEVEWGVFGIPRVAGVEVMGISYPLPYPVLIPAGTRLAARARSSAGGTTHEVGVTYVPVPLY